MTDPVAAVNELVSRLTEPMRAMGVAFSASLFGVLGSLIMGAAEVAKVPAGSALAVSKEINKAGGVFMTPVGADEITGKDCNSATFRWSVPTYGAIRETLVPLIKLLPEAKRWYTITPQYVFGDALLENARKVFAELGVEHIGNSYHSLQEQEFSGYLTNAIAAKPDVLVLLNFGSQSSNALRQAVNFGIKDRMKVLLVSGGFTFFADRVKDRLNIDFARSNQLEIVGGELTGGLAMQSWGDICDGAEKRRTLLEVASLLGIEAHECIAMGDGANDLPMMGAAGLSVAYHAKPKVREQAMVAINEGGLDRLLEVVQP